MSVVITAQPVNQTITKGGIVTFFIKTVGPGPISYQWYHNSNSIPNQTTPILTLSSVSLSDTGSYFCTAYSLEGGETISGIATLTIDDDPPSAPSSLGCMIQQPELTWNPYITDRFGGRGSGYIFS
jgi:hypothetical protein